MVSPDFKFYDFWLETYTDKEWSLTNMDLYLESIWKYCDNNIDNFKFKRVHRSDMCWWQYLYDFKTAEEYWKVFDYANKHNLEYLYKLTFSWAKDFWLEKIINVYHDDTFYVYIIDKTSNIDLLKLISVNSNKILIKEIVKNYILEINYFYDNKDNYNQNEWYKYWNDLSKKVEKLLKQIPEVNNKIF